MSKQQRTKPVFRICDAQIVPALSLWPDRTDLEGKSVAVGIYVHPDGDLGGDVRTSLIVAGSLEEGQVETLNSIYKFVDRPANQEKTDNGLWAAATQLMDQGQKETEDA